MYIFGKVNLNFMKINNFLDTTFDILTSFQYFYLFIFYYIRVSILIV